MSLLPRPEFQKNELLTSADLNAAQLYQVDLGRKHRAGAHLPGVVDGLGIVRSDTGLWLQAGYAVDEFGRDLVLGANQRLDSALADARFANHGADTFEVLLHYNQKIADGEFPRSRLDEAPRVEVRALIGAASEQMPYDVVQTAPDDPAFRRPVRLGVLTVDPDQAGGWMLRQNAGDRQEAGLVASKIVPARKDNSAISLAKGEFAVILPSAATPADAQKTATAAGEAAEQDKRLVVTDRGATLRGMLTVDGDVEAGQHLLLPTAGPLPAGAIGCGLFRIGDVKDAPDLNELRLVLPANGALAIGAWNQQSGKFEAILTVDSATRSVTVAGDLIIEGAVIEPATDAATKGGAGPSQEEDKGMLGNCWTVLAGYLTASGKTTVQTVPLLALLLAGLYWDKSAGMLPCQTVNLIRKYLPGDWGGPLLCHGSEKGVIIAGDTECTTDKKGNSLVDENGRPTESLLIDAVNGLAAPLTQMAGALKNPPTSIWIYCTNETSGASAATSGTSAVVAAQPAASATAQPATPAAPNQSSAASAKQGK
ncbi:hypothetical protein [Mesorhizobium sp. M0698]|uniref:hypothetical protein n=1 Tax=Mesorhizobium sp. M0698 TaxID=2956987 RepID=UPI0033384446